MLRSSSSFFLLVLAWLACTATAFLHVAAPVAPRGRQVMMATKAETVRVCGQRERGVVWKEGWLVALPQAEGIALKETATPGDALAFTLTLNTHSTPYTLMHAPTTVLEEDGVAGPGGEEDGRDQGHGRQGPLGRD